MDDSSEVRGDQCADEMFRECGGMFVAGKADAPGEVVAGCADDVTAASFEAGKGRSPSSDRMQGMASERKAGNRRGAFLSGRSLQEKFSTRKNARG